MNQFQLHHDAWGRLVLIDSHGTTTVGVEPIRAFPITSPREKIAICDHDGREVLWIEKLDEVPTETRRLLEDELSKRHFLPVIERIHEIAGRTEPTEWRIETDRGPTTFSVKSEEDVRRVAGSRVLIVDAHGIRYLIPDLKSLDGKSRRWLSRYI